MLALTKPGTVQQHYPVHFPFLDCLEVEHVLDFCELSHIYCARFGPNYKCFGKPPGTLLVMRAASDRRLEFGALDLGLSLDLQHVPQ